MRSEPTKASPDPDMTEPFTGTSLTRLPLCRVVGYLNEWSRRFVSVPDGTPSGDIPGKDIEALEGNCLLPPCTSKPTFAGLSGRAIQQLDRCHSPELIPINLVA